MDNWWWVFAPILTVLAAGGMLWWVLTHPLRFGRTPHDR